MIKRFDHAGVAVKNTEETAVIMSNLFGFEIVETLDQPAAGFKSTMLSKEDVTFELIEPVGPEGIIQKFIEKRGAGLHHLSIRVTDLDEEMKRLKALGVQFVTDEAAQIRGSKLIFIHPRSVGGLLIELIQRK